MKLLMLLGMGMLFAGPALAAPRLTFEGVLTDTDGALLNGPVALTFALYDTAEGGAALWSETHPDVEVLEGDFYATLGDIEPLGTVLATDAPLWIGLAVEDEGELSPRNPLTEVPRAAAALWAADVTGQHIHPREISVGNTRVIDAQGNWVGPAGPGGGGIDRAHRFTRIAGGHATACGLQQNGRALCWGQLTGSVPDVALTDISVGGTPFACGLRENREVLCFGYNQQGQLSAPFGAYTQVSAGGTHACALTVEQRAVCWGDPNFDRLAAPNTAFSSVVAGSGPSSCGIRVDDGHIECWGRPPPIPEGGGFVQIVVGMSFICGLNEAGTITCSGMANPPVGAYQQISAGFEHACAISRDGITRCWGTNFSGEAGLSGPGLVQVVTGFRYTCGRRADNTATCWGQGEMRVPEKWTL